MILSDDLWRVDAEETYGLLDADLETEIESEHDGVAVDDTYEFHVVLVEVVQEHVCYVFGRIILIMRKILVTGGAGFIGSHLADRLLIDGHEVHVVDNLENGRVEFVQHGCRTIFADVADASTLRYVRQIGFDVVYHLAAKPRVLYSVKHPTETTEVNVGKTVALLEACRGNVGRFVFVSSSSVYGDATVRPTSEIQPPDPRSPYALQKLVGEKFCELFSDLHGMDTASARPFNVFGPRQLAHGPYSTVVSSWLHAIKRGHELRSDGDGSQSRDMTHVSNVVDVLVRIGAFSGKLSGHVFNAGTGASISNNQIMAWLVQKHPEIVERTVHAPWRSGDVRATQADVSMIRRQLGFEVITDFWSGLRETYDWAMSSELF